MKVADMLADVPAPCHVIHVVWLRLELKCEDMMAALFSGCAVITYYLLLRTGDFLSLNAML